METGIQTLIYVIIAICVILAIALTGVLIYVWYRDNKNKVKDIRNRGKQDTAKSASTRLQGIESMSKFLAFDDITDSMIVRNGYSM